MLHQRAAAALAERLPVACFETDEASRHRVAYAREEKTSCTYGEFEIGVPPKTSLTLHNHHPHKNSTTESRVCPSRERILLRRGKADHALTASRKRMKLLKQRWTSWFVAVLLLQQWRGAATQCTNLDQGKSIRKCATVCLCMPNFYFGLIA